MFYILCYFINISNQIYNMIKNNNELIGINIPINKKQIPKA